MLLLSNDITLRWLKGKLWKNLQRFNYGLFILVLAHTLGYPLVIEREPIMQTLTIVLTIILLILQAVGIILTQRRHKH